MLRKFFAEMIGTFLLVTFGCGTAMLVGCDSSAGSGYLLTALAFGLAIVAIAYSLGNVSGGHVNPAVSLGVLVSGGMRFSEFCIYLIGQCIGAFAGSAFLAFIFSSGYVADRTLALGSNGLSGVHESALAGVSIEIALTAVFVFVILYVTSKSKLESISGIVIALTLVLVHILGIGLTGTSVNPARSFGPAMMSLLQGNPIPMGSLWVFVVGPFAGAAIAGCLFKAFQVSEKEA